MADKLVIVSTDPAITQDYTSLNDAIAAVDGGLYFAEGSLTFLGPTDDIIIRVYNTCTMGGNTTLGFGTNKPNSMIIEGNTVCADGDLSTLAVCTSTASCTISLGNSTPSSGPVVMRNLYLDYHNTHRGATSGTCVRTFGTGSSGIFQNVIVANARGTNALVGFSGDTRALADSSKFYNCGVVNMESTNNKAVGFATTTNNNNNLTSYYNCFAVDISGSLAGQSAGFAMLSDRAGSVTEFIGCLSSGVDGLDYETTGTATLTMDSCGSEDSSGNHTGFSQVFDYDNYSTPLQYVALDSGSGFTLLGSQQAAQGESDTLLTLDINGENRSTTSTQGQAFQWSIGPWDSLANSYNPTWPASGTGYVELYGSGSAQQFVSFSGGWFYPSQSSATVLQDGSGNWLVAGSGSVALGGSGATSVDRPVSGGGILQLGGAGAAFIPAAGHPASGGGILQLGGVGTAGGPDICSPYTTELGVPYTTNLGEEYSPDCDGILLAAGSGGLKLSGQGLAVLERHIAVSGAGEVVLQGTAAAVRHGAASGVGSVELSGSGDAVSKARLQIQGVGELRLSGSATLLRQKAVSGAGSLELSGSGLVTASTPFTASGVGSIQLGGAAAADRAASAYGTGSVSLGGLGSLSVGNRNYIAGQGSTRLSGSGTAVLVKYAAGSGGFKLAGIGTAATARDTICFSGTFLVDAASSAGMDTFGLHEVTGSGHVSLHGQGYAQASGHEPVSGTGQVRLSGSGNVNRKMNISGLGAVTLGGDGSLVKSGVLSVSGSGGIQLRGHGQTTKANFIRPVGCRLILVDIETRSFGVFKPQRQFNVDCPC